MPTDTASDVPFGHLAREMNRMLEQMSKGYSTFLPGDTWSPNVNLYETDRSYLVCVDLAGVDREAIELTVVDNRLMLRGRRDVPQCPGDLTNTDSQPCRARMHLMEIDHGTFAREVELPDNVDSMRINAVYRNGLLWVELPKTPTQPID